MKEKFITITTHGEVAALAIGQWVILEDGTCACLFETHIGFPQTMWGRKREGSKDGRFTMFTALHSLPLPLVLADLDPTYACSHKAANECGQCVNCGLPNVSIAEPMHLDSSGRSAFMAAARHNSRLANQ